MKASTCQVCEKDICLRKEKLICIEGVGNVCKHCKTEARLLLNQMDQEKNEMERKDRIHRYRF